MSALTFLSSLLQGSFPGNLHLVLVLRPSTFLQRTLSDVLFKKDEFKMKVRMFAISLFYLFFSGLLAVPHPENVGKLLKMIERSITITPFVIFFSLIAQLWGF